MISTNPIEAQYLNLILLKKFDEAFAFAKERNIDIFCDNNYIVLKILSLDNVELLASLKSQGLSEKMKDDLTQHSYLPLICLTRQAHNCLDWILKEKIIESNFEKKHSGNTLSELMMNIIETKIHTLNMPLTAKKLKLMNDSIKKVVNYIFPPLDIPNTISIIELMNKAIVEPSLAKGRKNNYYTCNPQINIEYVTAIIEARLLHQRLKSSNNTLVSPNFKL